MCLKKSDGKIICCYDTFEVHAVVAIYGLLWYLNSIYGIILMIIESHNICFFEWSPVCIVNTTIPIIWLLIITMVDRCCIKYWSLKKWHRRHYGAAFLYSVCCIHIIIIIICNEIKTKSIFSGNIHKPIINIWYFMLLWLHCITNYLIFSMSIIESFIVWIYCIDIDFDSLDIMDRIISTLCSNKISLYIYRCIGR